MVGKLFILLFLYVLPFFVCLFFGSVFTKSKCMKRNFVFCMTANLIFTSGALRNRRLFRVT